MKSVAIVLLAAAAAVARPALADGATAHPRHVALASAGAVPRDGRHDFDWIHGAWYATFKRLRHPLAGSHVWYSFDGTIRNQLIWDGRGNFETGRLNSPLGAIDFATLRLYDARTREWSIYWATAKAGLGVPPEVGSFDGHGNGTFYAWHDTYGTRPIASRYQWTAVDVPNHYHFEQAFSTDHGKTWEVNWISDVYRR